MSTELPDTLRSKSHFRLLDLVSEGEIEGLVGGLKSVYLDDTPIQNPDGSLNFQRVVLHRREGTQDQDYVPGFAAVESATSVGVEIKYGVPVVRTFTNANLNAVRLTVGIPALSYTNPENGDVGGISVGITVELQNNGGGFVSQPIGSTPQAMTWDGSTLKGGGAASTTYEVVVVLGGTTAVSTTYRVDYRLIGTTTWTAGPAGSLARTSGRVKWAGTQSTPATHWLTLPSGAYEFRVVNTGSAGSLSMSGNMYVPHYQLVITGKTTTRYQRDILIPLLGPGPWDVRVTRVSPDSATQYIQNKTYLDTTTEIVDAKLRYPNSAYFAVSVDASQFTSVPRRAYEIRGLKVLVPSNYDPSTRAYSGAWDGTFKRAWTDNPAWCFYDLLTNERYGLGGFIAASSVDKWSLYSIAQYCDKLVPDGFGGQEPRFVCNLYLQTRADAFKVLNDMASIFRGLIYWASASITAMQDSPADPAYLYTPANVIGGDFSYQGSASKARHTVALVTWNDPDDLYKQKVEYVEDRDGIARYGVVNTEVVAFGCTSRGQAHRVGKWLLFTERLQSEVVTFKTGLDGNLCRPGDIIKVADPARAGVRFGGRLAAATSSALALDAPVTLAAGQTYTLSTLKADGTVQESTVTTAAGTTASLAVSPAFSEAPAVGSIWVLASTAVQAQQFRVITVTEHSAEEFEVTALAHDPGKFDLIEQGIALEDRSISIITSRPAAPANGTVSEFLYEAATDLKTMAVFGWDAVPNAVLYRATYRVGDGNAVQLAEAYTNTITLQDAQPGSYTVTVRAVNGVGMESAPLTFSGTVLGKTAPPSDVSGLRLQVQSGGGLLSWDTAPDLDVRLGGKLVVRHSTAMSGAKWSTSVPLSEFAGSATSGSVPLLSGTYLAKFEDTSSVQSVNAVAVITDAPSVLQYNVVVSSDQAPSFAGAKTGLETGGGLLLLASSSTWDDIADFDAEPNIDGGTVPSGSYEFDAPIDLGATYSCRVTADIGVSSYDTANIVDAWASVDGVTNIDGALAGDTAAVRLYISTTTDDPALSPTWSDWRPFSVGDYLARGYRFRVEVERGSLATQQVAISRLAVTVDVPDRVEGGRLVSVPADGLQVSFAAEFFDTPAIAITADSMATGDYYVLSGKTAAGFFVRFYNSSGTAITKTMDWIAKGYGYKA